MPSERDKSEAPLFCDRCSSELVPGKGNFYVVKIEAVADPSPLAVANHVQADLLLEASSHVSIWLVIYAFYMIFGGLSGPYVVTLDVVQSAFS